MTPIYIIGIVPPCAAVRAGLDEGKDASATTEAARAQLRSQARDWLRADLAYWSKLAASAEPSERTDVARALRGWLEDPALAGVRDPSRLKPLADAERNEWQRLWGEVNALIAAVERREEQERLNH